MHKFWEGQPSLQEGKLGMLYTFSKMNSQQGLDSQIFTIFHRNGPGYMKGQKAGLTQFHGELPRRLATRLAQFPKEIASWLLGSLVTRLAQLPEGNSSWLLGHW